MSAGVVMAFSSADQDHCDGILSGLGAPAPSLESLLESAKQAASR